MDDEMETQHDNASATNHAPSLGLPLKLSGISSAGSSSRPVPPLALNLALKSRGISK